MSETAADQADQRLSSRLRSLRDAGDLELVDPPASLWQRIESAAAEPRDPQGCGVGTVVEYRIDHHDTVVGTGGQWDEFARSNEAPELADGVAGRTLWDAMAPGPLRDLWRAAVTRVRSSGAPATVPFRCDGPTTRRWYEMTLVPGPDGSVTFRSTSVFEMDRPEIEALRRGRRGGPGPSVEVCCWCAEAWDGARWRLLEEVLAETRALEDADPRVSDGFCPRCIDRMRTDLLTDGAGSDPASSR